MFQVSIEMQVTPYISCKLSPIFNTCVLSFTALRYSCRLIITIFITDKSFESSAKSFISHQNKICLVIALLVYQTKSNCPRIDPWLNSFTISLYTQRLFLRQLLFVCDRRTKNLFFFIQLIISILNLLYRYSNIKH